jgi:hypothetical protein
MHSSEKTGPSVRPWAASDRVAPVLPGEAPGTGGVNGYPVSAAQAGVIAVKSGPFFGFPAGEVAGTCPGATRESCHGGITAGETPGCGLAGYNSMDLSSPRKTRLRAPCRRPTPVFSGRRRNETGDPRPTRGPWPLAPAQENLRPDAGGEIRRRSSPQVLHWTASVEDSPLLQPPRQLNRAPQFRSSRFRTT